MAQHCENAELDVTGVVGVRKIWRSLVLRIILLTPVCLHLYFKGTSLFHWSFDLEVCALRCITIKCLQVPKCLQSAADDKRHEPIYLFAPQSGSAEDESEAALCIFKDPHCSRGCVLTVTTMYQFWHESGDERPEQSVVRWNGSRCQWWT